MRAVDAGPSRPTSTARVSGHQPASGLNSLPAYDALARPHRCQSCSALIASLTARLLSCLPLAGAHSQSTILANLTRPLTLVGQRCRSYFPRRWRLYVGGVVFRVAQIAGHDGSERLTSWQSTFGRPQPSRLPKTCQKGSRCRHPRSGNRALTDNVGLVHSLHKLSLHPQWRAR